MNQAAKQNATINLLKKYGIYERYIELHEVDPSMAHALANEAIKHERLHEEQKKVDELIRSISDWD